MNFPVFKSMCICALCIIFVCTTAVAHRSCSVPENDKRCIYKIVNPEGKSGTGFVISDSIAGYFLVTNKHVVQSSATKQYFDSVTVYSNIITKYGKVKSTDTLRTLYLRFGGRDFYNEHNNSDVDLVIIRLGPIGDSTSTLTNPSNSEWLRGFSMTMIADTRSAKILDGAIIQMIGYSERFPQPDQYPISRFGFVSSYPVEEFHLRIDSQSYFSKWIIVDASTRGGQSGGPAFYADPESKQVFLIGFVQASSEKSELTFIIPSHFIYEIIENIRVQSKK